MLCQAAISGRQWKASPPRNSNCSLWKRNGPLVFNMFLKRRATLAVNCTLSLVILPSFSTLIFPTASCSKSFFRLKKMQQCQHHSNIHHHPSPIMLVKQYIVNLNFTMATFFNHQSRWVVTIIALQLTNMSGSSVAENPQKSPDRKLPAQVFHFTQNGDTKSQSQKSTRSP